MANASTATSWIEAPKDHKLGLNNGKLVCLNAKGKPLAAIPPWLKDEPIYEQLQALTAWLDEHALQCLHAVEYWMLRSLVIPREVIVKTWVDTAWRAALENMVIASATATGKVDLEHVGLLRDVDVSRGLGIVDVDGESKWLKGAGVAVLHPILIKELDDLRELASDLHAQQPIEQLYRPVYQPTKEQSMLTSIRDFEGGVFEQLNFALGACRRLGYPVRGGYATCKVWEGDHPLEARYYIGGEYPEAETETGELIFVNKRQQAVTIRDVGPVTFSEGVRMASAIYAKRKVEKQEAADS
ncbi:MAG: DUF4132 domain-containing protein [Planctomycetaceae bacterium]